MRMPYLSTRQEKAEVSYTTLGHNERALFNSGLQTLILRATQWVSRRDVTIKPPAEMIGREASSERNLNWVQSDTTLILKNNWT